MSIELSTFPLTRSVMNTASIIVLAEWEEKKLYPHIVFTFRRIDLQDLSRQDYILEVDVWDKEKDTTRVDNLADSVENLLQAKNLPQEHILPTFYLIDRRNILDEDKNIKHRQIQFQIQNYER